jgi:hypothetical protein
MEIPNIPKNPTEYYCIHCDIKTRHKNDFNKHLLTRKHLRNEFGSDLEIKNPKKSQFLCKICKKIYKTSSGLWKHNQVCKNETNITNIDINKEEKLLFELLKQNNDFKELIMNQTNHMLEIFKNSSTTNNIINGNINNTQNTHFNLQIFLNETCKDAMTITEFINSLNPTLDDLEETGRLGYSEGITRIIVNGLKELDVSKRPIHCSDLKRETMFIKNTETWEKETEEKPLLLKAIKEVGKKNIANIIEWQKKHTHFNKYDSKQNDQYLQIVSNSMSGGTKQEQQHNYEKIVRNIAKETIINK